MRRIVSRYVSTHADQSWQGVAAFLSEFEEADARMLITEATTDQKPLPNPAQQIADITLRLRNNFLDRQIGALSQKASQPDLTEDEGLAILREQQELRTLKRQPLNPLSDAF